MAASPDRIEPSETVAVVDMGSNALRMVIAQVDAEGAVESLERASRPVGLGHDAFTRGKLRRRTRNAVIEILRDYRRIMDGYGVRHVRAVATSAMREVDNADSFLDRIARTVDVDVEVIEPIEQSRLVLSAVRHAATGHLDLARGVALVVEVGGGSTLLTKLRAGRTIQNETFKLGSVRMRELMETDREPPAHAAGVLDHHVRNVLALADKSMDLASVTELVVIGSDARLAAEQLGEPLNDSELMVVGAEDLRSLLGRCSGRTPQQLARDYGLAFADAETLTPALIVYRALLDRTGTDRMVVSHVSMRDGLLLDLPRYLSGEQDPEATASVLSSARELAAKYRVDAEHADHVATTALRLFDELTPDHRMQPRHRLLLHVAALLHEVGTFISNRAHHKHTLYVLENSELLGLRPADMQIVSNVARYHRRSAPKSSHTSYTALPRDQRMIVNRLAAILRVADALDHGHWQQVADFQLERLDNDLVVHVHGSPDLTLERQALDDKGDMFEDIYGLRVHLEEAPVPRTVPSSRESF